MKSMWSVILSRDMLRGLEAPFLHPHLNFLRYIRISFYIFSTHNGLFATNSQVQLSVSTIIVKCGKPGRLDELGNNVKWVEFIVRAKTGHAKPSHFLSFLFEFVR